MWIVTEKSHKLQEGGKLSLPTKIAWRKESNMGSKSFRSKILIYGLRSSNICLVTVPRRTGRSKIGEFQDKFTVDSRSLIFGNGL